MLREHSLRKAGTKKRDRPLNRKRNVTASAEVLSTDNW